MGKDSLYGTRFWTKDWNREDDLAPRICCFRKCISGEQISPDGILKIAADSRYKLYINGTLIQEGPCKANRGNFYYDTCQPGRCLQEGMNCIAVEVLRYPEDFGRRNHSLLRTGLPYLYLEGGEELEALTETAGWKSRTARHICFQGENTVPAPLHIVEDTVADASFHGWKRASFEDRNWAETECYGFERMKLSDTPRSLKKRPIPAAVLRPGAFLQSPFPIVVPAGSSLCVELDAGELMTAYCFLKMSGGEGSRISLLYGESYYLQKRGIFYKENRSESERGILLGNEDHYQVSGAGTEEQPEEYAPFWFRTFRYVRLAVEAGKTLVLHDFRYLETGYPLKVCSCVKTSDKSMGRIWEISERTLKRCMHDTYVDCPYYEQLQYAMDARSEILYTYAVSADDRLARRCMEDFRCSVNGEGLVNSCAPALRAHVIPGFSIYYILMVYDHMMYFGDRELLFRHVPAIDGVLSFFHSHLDERGLVERIGGKNQKQDYWSFIDWTREWDETTGVPTAVRKGGITMESLLYLLGLFAAARINGYLDRKDTAREYEKRADRLKKAVRKHCMGLNGLIQDGPGIEEYSVHCQVFAVLAGVLTIEEGRKALEKTVGVQGAAQCSVAMSYYLFRALEKTGQYERTDELWEIWRGMLEKDLTTCVENDTDERSDCHGWGALALYELPAVILGVRPASPGFAAVRISPCTGRLSWAEGNVITPRGMIRVKWKKEKGKINLQKEIPEDIVEV